MLAGNKYNNPIPATQMFHQQNFVDMAKLLKPC